MSTADDQDILAVVTQDRSRWLGRIVGIRSGGPPRVQFPEGKSPSLLPLGSRVTLSLAARGMAAPSSGGCTMISLELALNGPIVGLLLDNPALLDTLPRFERPPEERTWFRTPADPARPTQVPVRLSVGPPSGRHLAGGLVDSSRGGVGLKFPLAAESRLCLAPVMWCTLQLDEDRKPVERPCEVRSRVLVQQQVRYGLAFRELTEANSLARPYEVQWHCKCGTRELLGESHSHCCGCGEPRTQPLNSDPSWSDKAPAHRSTFTGIDQVCAHCGSAWSLQARCCGHCGKPLVKPRGSVEGSSVPGVRTGLGGPMRENKR